MLPFRSFAFVLAIALPIASLAPPSTRAGELDFGNRPESSLPDTWQCPHTIVTKLPGIAEPLQQVTLSSPIEGTLATISVSESSHVGAGETVASLDARDLEANLALANATLARTSNAERVELELKLAEQNLARTKQLFQQRATSQARLDQDEAVAKVARTQLFEANEQRREAELRRDAVQAAIDLRTIRAPFAAQVIRLEGQVGQTIRRAEPVLRLVNLERLKVDLHLPSSTINEAVVGAQYGLWAAAPINQVVVAKLISKEPIVDAATKTVRCRFEIDNLDTQYPAGFAVGLIDLADPIHSERTGPQQATVAERDTTDATATAF